MFSQLSIDQVQNIILFLPLADIGTFARVCNEFYSLISPPSNNTNDFLWEELLKRDFAELKVTKMFNKLSWKKNYQSLVEIERTWDTFDTLKYCFYSDPSFSMTKGDLLDLEIEGIHVTKLYNSKIVSIKDEEYLYLIQKKITMDHTNKFHKQVNRNYLQPAFLVEETLRGVFTKEIYRSKMTHDHGDNFEHLEIPGIKFEKKVYTIIDVMDQEFVILIDDDGNVRDDIKLCDGKARFYIQSETSKGNEVLCTLVKFLDMEGIFSLILP